MQPCRPWCPAAAGCRVDPPPVPDGAARRRSPGAPAAPGAAVPMMLPPRRGEAAAPLPPRPPQRGDKGGHTPIVFSTPSLCSPTASPPRRRPARLHRPCRRPAAAPILSLPAPLSLAQPSQNLSIRGTRIDRFCEGWAAFVRPRRARNFTKFFKKKCDFIHPNMPLYQSSRVCVRGLM